MLVAGRRQGDEAGADPSPLGFKNAHDGSICVISWDFAPSTRIDSANSHQFSSKSRDVSHHVCIYKLVARTVLPSFIHHPILATKWLKNALSSEHP
jgi:hypothetical protein